MKTQIKKEHKEVLGMGQDWHRYYSMVLSYLDEHALDSVKNYEGETITRTECKKMIKRFAW